jgi:dihydroorotate dehydrogenase
VPDVYPWLRGVGFRFDPERVHAIALRGHRALGRVRRIRPPGTPVEVMGIEFPNVVGLAAGYDKDAVAWRGLAALGFGHLEIGTVTPEPQPGNPRPRIVRFVDDEAMVNRMGFPSEGSGVVARRLRGARGRGAVIGVSIGPNGFSDGDRAASDYEVLVDRFAPLADYLAVNVSSPNTEGLRSLEMAGSLAPVLGRIAAARDAAERRVPVAVKLSPDIDPSLLDGVVGAVEDTGLDGIIVTNTTTLRPGGVAEHEAGGLSGTPLREIAMGVLERVRALTSLPIIASGGVMTVDDARDRLDAGAALVQLYTGFVYRGPRLVKEIAGLG